MFTCMGMSPCNSVTKLTELHTPKFISFGFFLVSNYSLHASHLIGIVAELDSILVCMHANFLDFFC
jgi:hypothetical protein